MVNKNKNSECTGSYEVSGYTTDDGKKVDSYTRRCWKHGGGNSVTNFMGEMPNPMGNPIPTSQPNPTSSDKPNWGGIWNDVFQTGMQIYLNSMNNRQNNAVNNYFMPTYTLSNDNATNTTYQNYEFLKFDVKKTEENIKNSIKNTENILKQRIITKEDIAKINNQTQMVMHNLFDDIEDLSVQKSNLPEIPTVESSEESQKIENDRKQIRENAYQTILMLYQQRNVVEKQWKKVSTKDEDYDNKFNQYIENKQEIEKLSDTAKDLFDYASKIDDTTLEKVKKLREDLKLMRVRPMPLKKQVKQQQKWIWPVSIGHIITSGFGNRMHPVKHRLIFHDGIDINAKLNTQIYAVADGKVIMAQWYNGYGNYIEINHGNGIHSFYGHLNSFNVKVGDYVFQGQIIAKSGNTGIGTGAHLHFGVHKNGQKVNPLDFLPKSQ